MTTEGLPTSKDVAALAGVSQSTVSMVLSGKWPGRVSPSTAQIVRDAAVQLGYQPNPAARNLRLGRTRTVLLVVPTLTAPFFAAVYTGAARVAAGHGFGLVVYPWPDASGGPFAAPHEAFDGVLASSMAIEALTGMRRPVPLVMLDSDPAGAAPTVNFDVDTVVGNLADHLLGLGHRRIGHLAAAVEAWTFQRRAISLAEAVARTPGASLVTREAPISIETGRETAHEMLSAPDRPTALVCDYDILAVGAYKAAKALGLSVPGDVSITGFDDIPLAEAIEPELTTVRLPAEELGSQAMSALLELMQNRSPGSPLLPADLIVRKSTAAPARRPPNGSTGTEGSKAEAQGSNR